VLKSFLDTHGITIIILLYFFPYHEFLITKIKLPIKCYANCKLRTFQTLNLEYVSMDQLCPNVSLNLEPF
jgi:hypothetical protein